MLTSWFSAFVFTQVVEVPLYLRALARGCEPPPAPRSRATWLHRLGIAFLCSALTHPYVWFVFPQIFYDSDAYEQLAARWPALHEHRYTLFFITAESFAVLVEALVLRASGLRRALLWALLANAASAGLGIASRRLLGWP